MKFCARVIAAFLALAGAAQAHVLPPEGLKKIRHIIVIMQENRSFDSYFGTFPGADGIPMKNGTAAVCAPDPATGACVKPYHDSHVINFGGPHGNDASVGDVAGRAMDGFVIQARKAIGRCRDAFSPTCARGTTVDVMGWHDDREIPNYWAYARNFVLEDHMFEPNASWSLPSHLFEVSAWSAKCSHRNDPFSCTNALELPGFPPDYPPDQETHVQPIYAWTDLTWLLHKNNTSWGYFVVAGREPDCEDDDAVACRAIPQDAKTPGIWNPLPYFDTVRNDGEVRNIRPVGQFLKLARSGNLPAVSWVVPSGAVSEHPPASIAVGQAFVTTLVDAVMRGPNWQDCAIFISWDDWGGFYDHVVPPSVDQNGYGIRVPGILISPYAKKGLVDHQTLSFDAYLKFIEDVFLDSQRLNPANDGRPDPRPTVREKAPILGDLAGEFDFSQRPRAPLLLKPYPNGHEDRPR